MIWEAEYRAVYSVNLRVSVKSETVSFEVILRADWEQYLENTQSRVGARALCVLCATIVSRRGELLFFTVW